MIRKVIHRIGDLPLLAAAALVSSMPTAALAAADDGLGGVAEDVNVQLGNVGKLMTAGGFVAGIVMLATGLLKLKQAAEDQGKTKYSEGAWRIAVGAGLVALVGFNSLLGESFGLDQVENWSEGGGVTF